MTRDKRFRGGWKVLALSAVILASAAFAQELPAELLIEDNGAMRLFERAQERQSNGGDVILFEKGVRRTDAARRQLTRRVHVHLQPQVNPEALALELGAAAGAELSYAPGHYIFTTSGPHAAWQLAQALRAKSGVISADPILARKRKPRFVPNDPFFVNQWHLRNDGQRGGTPGADIDVVHVWDTYRGRGVNIAIVDDGLLQTHPDLAPNVNAALGTDLRDFDSDPSPEGGPGVDWNGEPEADSHGTAVAGLLGARGDNSMGGTGVAFESSLIGVRLLGGDAGDDQEAEGLSYLPQVVHVSNNSWGSEDDGETLGGAGSLVSLALQSGATSGRGGRGTVYVFAAGNGGELEDDANYDSYVNSIYTIAVGATNDRGEKASYSEPGACLVVSAPGGNDAYRFQGITTTDLVGEFGYNYEDAGSPAFPEFDDRDYTQNFSGTSAAAPIVSGVAALMLEANPALGWRDVQEILLRSARKVQPDNAQWLTNQTGFQFNPDFGAGLVNAGAAVNLAETWINLPAQEKIVADQPSLGLFIPPDDPAGLQVEFMIADTSFRAEHVTLKLDALVHTRGNLAITLTSPSGIVNHLAKARPDPNPDYNKYTFMSLFHWGENPSGVWTLRIIDEKIYPPRGPAPMLHSAQLTVFGTTPDPAPLVVSAGFDENSFQVTVTGTAGKTYELQSTTDFVTWIEAATITAAAEEFEMTDSDAAAGEKFYRVRVK